MMSPSNATASKLTTQVVVVGAGGAGLAAAVSAAENGAKVIVVEKRRRAGGNTVFAEGLFGAESPTQKRLLIDARRDVLFKIAMDYAHWTLNPRLVRTFIDRSGDTIGWLESKGLKFHVPPLYINQVPLTWHCPPKNGGEIIDVFIKDCKKLGVKILYSSRAKKILKDRSGKVTGLVVETEGKEVTIQAKYIIIASGGYGGNKKMLKKYAPLYDESIRYRGVPDGSVGDGLIMAEEAGAANEGLGIIQYTGPNCLENAKLTGIAREPTTVWVNKRGERFFDEGTAFMNFDAANTLIRQPEAISFTLFDEKLKQESITEGPIKMMLGGIYEANTSTLEEDIKSQMNGGAVKVARSWSEIAKWMGADPATLSATIKEYNSFCDRGYDPVFAKDIRYLIPLRTPPFYAVRCHPTFLTTIGGIKINHHMEVLDKNEKPIEGLYATGNDAGGWESETYCAILSGSTLGFAINSGRIAGENAAAKARSKK